MKDMRTLSYAVRYTHNYTAHGTAVNPTVAFLRPGSSNHLLPCHVQSLPREGYHREMAN